MFVSNWFGWERNLEGPPIDLSFGVPRAIQTINRRLGRLWLETPPAKIFNLQDRLIPPQEYGFEPSGVVPIIWENQGVWGCGYKPETSSQLWVTGDWPDDQCGMREWRPTPDAIDIPIIFVILGNAVWASRECVMDENDEKPGHSDRLLWTFAPFAGFLGFWADRDMTLIRMQGSGWGVTARR